jgi:hypothetical protein
MMGWLFNLRLAKEMAEQRAKQRAKQRAEQRAKRGASGDRVDTIFVQGMLPSFTTGKLVPDELEVDESEHEPTPTPTNYTPAQLHFSMVDWFNSIYVQQGSLRKYITVKQVYAKLKASTFFAHLSKREKRKLNRRYIFHFMSHGKMCLSFRKRLHIGRKRVRCALLGYCERV